MPVFQLLFHPPLKAFLYLFAAGETIIKQEKDSALTR